MHFVQYLHMHSAQLYLFGVVQIYHHSYQETSWVERGTPPKACEPKRSIDTRKINVAVPGFEPGLPDSESGVLTTTLHSNAVGAQLMSHAYLKVYNNNFHFHKQSAHKLPISGV